MAMERGGKNLEALTEVEDEEWGHDGGVGSDSDEDDGDGGVRRDQPNQFDNLCDGVLNTLALVHASMNELLELKDELLKHTLPPNSLTKVALTTTRVFRSVSDMHMPVNELIRLVRLYSTPWEEKSTALKKLHEDYEAKKTQLNIAIKRLQLIDTHSKRIAKERRIMNWEKVFAKVTAAKGHGRRWKFLIDDFKLKVAEGPEQLQEYVNTVAGEVGSDDEDVDVDMPTQMQHAVITPSEPEDRSTKYDDSDVDEDEDAEEEEVIIEPSEDGNKAINSDTGSVASTVRATEAGTESEPPVTVIRPVMKDKEIWTGEPEYDQYLHVRVYKPEGLECHELKCALSYGEQLYKTGILDPSETAEAGRATATPALDTLQEEDEEQEEPPKEPTEEQKKTQVPKDKTQDKQMEYEEVVFEMKDFVQKGILKPPGTKVTHAPEHLRVAVHFGPAEEIIAMATIDMDDLDNLDLPEVVKPIPTGDVWRSGYIEDDEECDGTLSARSEKITDEVLKGLAPVRFPLYSIHGSKAESVHLPTGTLPLLIYWGKRPRAKRMNRMTESETLHEIVYDLTGFDLDVTTKEELHKDMQDEALSAISFTPEPQTETVLKEEYDKLVQSHTEELEKIQKEYEQRLQEVAESLQQAQQAQMEREMARLLAQERMAMAQHIRSQSQQRVSPSPAPRSSPRPRSQEKSSPAPAPTPKPTPNESPKPPSATLPTTVTNDATIQTNKGKRQGRVTKPLPKWGENLPADFLERLKLFEEQTNTHKAEVMERLQRETTENVERQLATQYKLSKNMDDDTTDPLNDVSLPAVFMPSKSNNMHIYNPRAAKYFHATGSGGARLTQAPSMVQLPPLPKNKVSVVNLFDLSQNFQRAGPEWLIQRFLGSQATSHTPGSILIPTGEEVGLQDSTPAQYVESVPLPRTAPSQQHQNLQTPGVVSSLGGTPKPGLRDPRPVQSCDAILRGPATSPPQQIME